MNDRAAIVKSWFVEVLANVRCWGDEPLPQPDDEDVERLLESLGVGGEEQGVAVLEQRVAEEGS